MSRFFIDRPIFAWVIALIIMLAGALAITRLPVSRYPNIAPPTVSIIASYPGASAKTVEDSVTQIIEQNLTGLDGLLYFSSTSDNDGNVVDRADLPERHQSGHRPGPGAEQAAAGDAALAADRAAAGHQRQQGERQLFDGRRLRLRGRTDDRRRHRRLPREQRHRPAEPRSRRRARSSSSAPSTPCASGSIRTSSRPMD